MEEQIRKFGEQLAWAPQIENRDQWVKSDKFIVAGMGGSALAGALMRVAQPKLDLVIHRDYGLPRVGDSFLRSSLLILSSYSGNTVETIDTGREALEMGLRIAVVTSGGKLLDWAKHNTLPYIILPVDYQSRMALGYSCKAIGAFMGDDNLLAMLSTTVLASTPLEAQGEALAAKLKGRVLGIYSSTINSPLAYHWKIMLNETSKVPAFANVFPELNHNEMQSQFDPKQFAFVFLRDGSHDPRIEERLDKLKIIYEKASLPVEVVQIAGATVWAKIFHSVILANWTAFHLARLLNHDPESVPLIEEFKKSITN